MSWQNEMVTILKNLVVEFSTESSYSDEDLSELILVAAQLIQTEITFGQTYVIDVDQYTLTPDPTCDPKDNDFINLTILKAACILDKNEARAATGRGFAFTDAGARVDLKGVLDGKLKFLDKGWCQSYEQAKLEFKVNGLSNSGRIILAPYRSDGSILNDSSYFR